MIEDIEKPHRSIANLLDKIIAKYESETTAELERKVAEEEGISRPSYFRLKKEAVEKGLATSEKGLVALIQ